MNVLSIFNKIDRKPPSHSLLLFALCSLSLNLGVSRNSGYAHERRQLSEQSTCDAFEHSQHEAPTVLPLPPLLAIFHTIFFVFFLDNFLHFLHEETKKKNMPARQLDLCLNLPSTPQKSTKLIFTHMATFQH